MKKGAADLVVAAIAIVLATIYLIATYDLRVLTLSDPLGPKAFPALLGSLMLLCGVSLAPAAWRRYRSEAASASEGKVDADSNHHPMAVGAVALWMLGYYVVLEPLGFILATVPFLFGLMAFFNRGRWFTNAAVAILFPVVLDWIFSHVLGMPPAPGLFSL